MEYGIYPVLLDVEMYLSIITMQLFSGGAPEPLSGFVLVLFTFFGVA